MKLISDDRKCSGCGVCKLACSIKNFSQVTPAKALLRIEGHFPSPGQYQIHFCDQCGMCAEACPADAITLMDGIYQINEADCIACHECVDACPHSVMIIKKEDDMPAKCILCSECARVCPRGAILLAETELTGEVE